MRLASGQRIQSVLSSSCRGLAHVGHTAGQFHATRHPGQPDRYSASSWACRHVRRNVHHTLPCHESQAASPVAGAISAPQLTPLEGLFASGARLTNAAQMAWSQVLRPGDVAVDATCGNGHDTLFLAQAVGPSGTVYGLDIQESAVQSTQERLNSQLDASCRPRLHVHQACHSRLQELVGSSRAKVVCFNLGYLPSGDKAITTGPSSTTAAVEAALEVVCPGGLISIMAYIGHPGGLEEYQAVSGLISELSPNYWVSTETRLLNRPTAPIMLLVWRGLDSVPGEGQSAGNQRRRRRR